MPTANRPGQRTSDRDLAEQTLRARVSTLLGHYWVNIGSLLGRVGVMGVARDFAAGGHRGGQNAPKNEYEPNDNVVNIAQKVS